MRLQSIAVVAVIALFVSGCGMVEKAKQYADSQPTMTVGAGTPSIPNLNDLAGNSVHEQLVKQGFQPNADKSEYTRGPAVIQVQNGVPNKVRLTYPQGTIECPPTVMVYFSYAQLADSLFGLGYDGVLKKHVGLCKPV